MINLYYEIQTFVQIKATLYSRPLTLLSLDLSDLAAFTPMYFSIKWIIPVISAPWEGGILARSPDKWELWHIKHLSGTVTKRSVYLFQNSIMTAHLGMLGHCNRLFQVRHLVNVCVRHARYYSHGKNFFYCSMTAAMWRVTRESVLVRFLRYTIYIFI